MNNISSMLKGRWTLWVFALFFALLAGFGTLMILGQSADRVSYYVVSADVAAGVEITPAQVTEIASPADAVPPHPMTLADLQSAHWYSRVPLAAGTVLQKSMVTTSDSATAGLPDGFVESSILVAPEDAVAGRIVRGDYIDIAAISGTDVNTATTKIVMQHVLVMDVTVSPATLAQAANSATQNADGTTVPASKSALYSGVASMYTLAVSPTDFAKLSLIRKGGVYLALSASQTPSSLDVSMTGGTLFNGSPVTPSSPQKSSSGLSVTPKSQVETFFTTNKAKAGVTFTVASGTLEAIDATGTVVDSISLSGGSIDLTTGIYTAGN